MIRLPGSWRCRRCNVWDGSDYVDKTGAERAATIRQIQAGECDSCQRRRYAAAVEYMAAADAVRILMRGVALGLLQPPMVLLAAHHRIADAEAACEWWGLPISRPVPSGPVVGRRKRHADRANR